VQDRTDRAHRRDDDVEVERERARHDQPPRYVRMAPAIKFSGQKRSSTGRRVWRFDLARIVAPAPGGSIHLALLRALGHHPLKWDQACDDENRRNDVPPRQIVAAKPAPGPSAARYRLPGCPASATTRAMERIARWPMIKPAYPAETVSMIDHSQPSSYEAGLRRRPAPIPN